MYTQMRVHSVSKISVPSHLENNIQSIHQLSGYEVMVMVFNGTFKNISVISWLPVLLVEETGIPEKKTPTCHKSLTQFIT